MNCDQLPSNEWLECPQGELLHVRQRLCEHARQSCQRVRRIVLFFLLLLVAGGAWGVSQWHAAKQQPVLVLSCEQCAQQFAAYRDHLQGIRRMGDLDLLSHIETHLAHCPECRQRFEQEFPGLLDRSRSNSLLHTQRELIVWRIQRTAL